MTTCSATASAVRAALASIRRSFESARRYAALSSEPRAVRFHDLRHTAISRLANNPAVPLVYAQAFARHKDIKTTMLYVHKIESEETTAAAMAALG
jgi:integrase